MSFGCNLGTSNLSSKERTKELFLSPLLQPCRSFTVLISSYAFPMACFRYIDRARFVGSRRAKSSPHDDSKDASEQLSLANLERSIDVHDAQDGTVRSPVRGRQPCASSPSPSTSWARLGRSTSRCLRRCDVPALTRSPGLPWS